MERRRKSGIREDKKFSTENLDFSEFITPYITFEEEYRNILEEKEAKKHRAYIVTYVNNPSLVFFCFTDHKDKAKGIATKYFKENHFPDFEGRGWREQHKYARGRKIPEFDKYWKSKLIPITELMKIGAKFHCSLCNQHLFSLEDVDAGRCHVIEDEGDFLNPFTKGFVLCHDCYTRLISNS